MNLLPDLFGGKHPRKLFPSLEVKDPSLSELFLHTLIFSSYFQVFVLPFFFSFLGGEDPT